HINFIKMKDLSFIFEIFCYNMRGLFFIICRYIAGGFYSMAKLFFYYSTMAAGKSMEIIKVAYNYEVQGKKVVALTSHLDNRFEMGKIWSRAGFEKDAHTYNNDTDIKQFILDLQTRPTSVLI